MKNIKNKPTSWKQSSDKTFNFCITFFMVMSVLMLIGLYWIGLRVGGAMIYRDVIYSPTILKLEQLPQY